MSAKVAPEAPFLRAIPAFPRLRGVLKNAAFSPAGHTSALANRGSRHRL